jgi:hypothetical protein
MDASSPRTSTLTRGATAALLLAAATLLLLGGRAAAHGMEVRGHVARGTPRPVAECMVRLGYSAGACEVGMFTGTSEPSWERDPALAEVAAAVRAVAAAGGRWELREVRGTTLVCARIPDARPACAADVRAALRLGGAGSPAHH